MSEARAAHGNDAVAAYLGNPNAHNLGPVLYNRVFLQSLGSTNVYSASTVDQMPKQVSAGLMFGAALSIPVPDVDRTDYLLMLGANPFASNGSLWTAPDLPGRLRALQARGGKYVVVDPRRSKTAEEADELLSRPTEDGIDQLLQAVERLRIERSEELSVVNIQLTSLAAIVRDFLSRGDKPSKTVRSALIALAYLRNPYDRIFDLHVEGGLADDVEVIKQAWREVKRSARPTSSFA